MAKCWGGMDITAGEVLGDDPVPVIEGIDDAVAHAARLDEERLQQRERRWLERLRKVLK